MKTSKISIVAIWAFCVTGWIYGAANEKSLLELEYGTYFESQNGSLFTSANKTKFNLNTNIGLLLVGYFNPSYNIEQLPHWGTSTATFKQSMLDNFNVLASGSNWATGMDGYQSVMGEIVDFTNPLGVGGEVKAFLMTISGVSDFQDAYAEDIKEFGIYHDSSWGYIPEGGFFPENYSVKGASYDSVILGAELEGEGIGLGNAYAAQMIPEPSTYGLLIGLAALGLVWWRRIAPSVCKGAEKESD